MSDAIRNRLCDDEGNFKDGAAYFEMPAGDVICKASNNGKKEDILAKTSAVSFSAGPDSYTVSWNSFVLFDGRKHNGAGIDASGQLSGGKESGSRAFDLKVSVLKNGETDHLYSRIQGRRSGS